MSAAAGARSSWLIYMCMCTKEGRKGSKEAREGGMDDASVVNARVTRYSGPLLLSGKNVEN